MSHSEPFCQTHGDEFPAGGGAGRERGRGRYVHDRIHTIVRGQSEQDSEGDEQLLMHHLQAVALSHAVSLISPLVTRGVTHCSVEL